MHSKTIIEMHDRAVTSIGALTAAVDRHTAALCLVHELVDGSDKQLRAWAKEKLRGVAWKPIADGDGECSTCGTHQPCEKMVKMTAAPIGGVPGGEYHLCVPCWNEEEEPDGDITVKTPDPRTQDPQ